MEGIPILAVVDTAAQVSVINAKLAKKWALKKAEAHSFERRWESTYQGRSRYRRKIDYGRSDVYHDISCRRDRGRYAVRDRFSIRT